MIEKQMSTEQIYNGKILRLRKDEVELINDNKAVREVVEHSGGVCVLPLTECDQVVLVKQFRYPFEKVLLEIPAGKLELGESPLECGKRELYEETGFNAKTFDFLGKLYPTPAYCTEVIHMYLARGLCDASNEGQHLDQDEFVDVVKMPFDKVIDMIFNDEIHDAKTQLAMLKAKVMLNN
ncbi:MAG: NUDIX hydrolase [Oscillospiraceae bacterium]|nr:NUDIX hydrolase [Oscillospiraceae bacterium]